MTILFSPTLEVGSSGPLDFSVNTSAPRADLDSRTSIFAIALIALLAIAVCIKYTMSYLSRQPATTNHQQPQQITPNDDPSIAGHQDITEVDFEAVVTSPAALRADLPKETGEIAKLINFITPFSGFIIPGQNAPLARTLVLNEDISVWNFDGRLDVRYDGDKVIDGVGCVKTVNIWKVAPQLDASETIPNAQKVRLPKGYSLKAFNEDRQRLQEGVINGSGPEAPAHLNISNEKYAHELAYRLGGVVVEGVYPYDTEHILKGNMKGLPSIEGHKVPMHVILTTGLNFNGYKGGGVPCDQRLLNDEVQDFSLKNAAAAINSAHENGSDVLVFNVFGGTGFFGGKRKQKVREGNMNGIAKAMRLHKEANPTSELRVMLPTEKRDQFNDKDFICHPCDKDKAAAYLARKGYKVSVHVAGDPMSITGVHGTGLWWQSCGMASDEERVAFTTESYKGAYTPAVLIDSKGEGAVIPALSQFMVQK